MSCRWTPNISINSFCHDTILVRELIIDISISRSFSLPTSTLYSIRNMMSLWSWSHELMTWYHREGPRANSLRHKEWQIPLLITTLQLMSSEHPIAPLRSSCYDTTVDDHKVFFLHKLFAQSHGHKDLITLFHTLSNLNYCDMILLLRHIWVIVHTSFS